VPHLLCDTTRLVLGEEGSDATIFRGVADALKALRGTLVLMEDAYVGVCIGDEVVEPVKAEQQLRTLGMLRH